jgi:methylated-DNA-protein-cysteine methyltransferase-like protein
MNSQSDSTYTKIYDIARRIPRGKVATYGQIARLAGFPKHARLVGYAMHSIPDGEDIPWHRVINSKGEISLRSAPGCENQQQTMLEAEGVEFNLAGRVNLKKYQWNP